MNIQVCIGFKNYSHRGHLKQFRQRFHLYVSTRRIPKLPLNMLSLDGPCGYSLYALSTVYHFQSFHRIEHTCLQSSWTVAESLLGGYQNGFQYLHRLS